MGDGGEESAQGARIEGKIDVVRALLESSQRINDERHVRISGDVDDLRNRMHRHGNELMVAKAEISALNLLPPRVDRLETNEAERVGERKGVITSGRALVWLAGLIPGGLVA